MIQSRYVAAAFGEAEAKSQGGLRSTIGVDRDRDVPRRGVGGSIGFSSVLNPTGACEATVAADGSAGTRSASDARRARGNANTAVSRRTAGHWACPAEPGRSPEGTGSASRTPRTARKIAATSRDRGLSAGAAHTRRIKLEKGAGVIHAVCAC